MTGTTDTEAMLTVFFSRAILAAENKPCYTAKTCLTVSSISGVIGKSARRD